MLKTRLIPVLYIMNGLIVRSEGFNIHQNIGNVINQAQRYNDWNVDELIYLDITRAGGHDLGRNDHGVSSYQSMDEIISLIAKNCRMPLAFGGKIQTCEDAVKRISKGADKITINHSALAKPELITEISNTLGRQAVIVSIDYKIINNTPYVFDHFGTINTNISLFDWAKECELLGAGELLINSIDRDGKSCGYDMNTIGTVCDLVGIPVIACGGAGDFYDFVDVAKATKVSGIAAGNIFHFTELAYPRAKKLLRQENINVRI